MGLTRDEYLDLCLLEDEELQAIVRAAKTGGNVYVQLEAKAAQNILDNRAESAGVAEEERRFREYWEGGETREDRDRQDLRDAGRAW